MMQRMTLDEFFTQPDAPSMAAFSRRININPDQVRQWRHAYGDRRPNSQTCVLLEEATEGKVMRWDLWPTDWHKNWPELKDHPAAPPIPVEAEA